MKLNKIEKEDNLGDVGGEQSVKRMFKEEGLANVREKRIVLRMSYQRGVRAWCEGRGVGHSAVTHSCLSVAG